ncbi:MAG: ATP-dependent sacrificial sulfur transferase LarE [Deltaproteobacteria bacterium]|nr:ATP-dependent sacrificial sulfur transferase LarE [Deltaproteobacteria bacterium]
MIDKEDATSKKENLIHYLEKLDSLLVAFSGGVDSTFLLALSHQTLTDNVVAVTESSTTYPSREREEAIKFTKDRGIEHIVFQADETSIAEFVSNAPDRCYHCKKSLSKNLLNIAKEKSISHVAYAANLDDLSDYRPGMDAAREMGIIAPLVDAHLSKEEIRFLSKEMGLPTWDKPAMACLASRIPYGDPITTEKLKMVEEAEDFLADQGFRQYRVRHHGSVARIEVAGSEIKKVTDPELRKNIVEKFRQIGFYHIAVDLEGYFSGSMNRVLKNKV